MTLNSMNSVEGEMRKTIIIVSAACNYRRGSEYDVGWNLLMIALGRYRVHLIATNEDMADLLEFKAKNPNAELFLHFIKFGDIRLRPSSNAFVRYYHHRERQEQWLERAYLAAKQIVEEEPVYFIWKNTPCGFRSPGRFHLLPVPSVLGPLSGYVTCRAPFRLRREYYGDFYQKSLLFLRPLLNALAIRVNPKVRAALKHTDVLIASAPHMQRLLRDHYGRGSVQLVQSGIDQSKISHEIPLREPCMPLNICWCAGLVPGKGLPLVLKGLAKLRGVDWHLHILGDGFQRKLLEEMPARLGVQERCTFYGRRTREFVFEKMKECHLFVLLSYSDLAPSVIGEAFSCGLPVVALDTEGFNHVTDSSTGCLLPAHSCEQVEEDLSRFVTYISSHENERRELANNALRRASTLTYDAKESILIHYIESEIAKLEQK
jgi:glycosyltransferase involved in cell wall biosynthesis